MKEETIINVSHRPDPVIWIYDGKRVEYKKLKTKNWIFVTGDRFDLEFLESQLDIARNISYEHAHEKDIHGENYGLKVYVSFSAERRIIEIIHSIGGGRKYRIFNGLMDPDLKIMATSHLRLFNSGSALDYSSPIPSMECSISYINGNFDHASINGTSFQSESKAIDAFLENFPHCPFIIYNNANQMAHFLLRMGVQADTYIKFRLGKERSFMSYGRVNHSDSTIHIRGKVAINSRSFMYSEGGISGLMEISMLTGLPLETVCRVTPGTAVSSMENYDALDSNILVLTDKDDHEMEKPVEVFMDTDKGGYVMQPYPGLYRNIYELDFSSMYPSIMHHFNMSPETIGTHGFQKLPGDNPYFTMALEGFIPSSLDKLLKRRLIYKYNKKFREDFRQRDKVLKWLLLTSFGYTGFKNARFGKIEMHEAITSVGRWALQSAMRISERHGFKIIHGIVDSLFLSGSGNMNAVLREIRKETSINIVMDGYYKWMVFLPARSGLGALNRYFGLKYGGEYKVRGIGLRRSDSPQIILKMQEEILDLLSNLNFDENEDHIWKEYCSIRDRYVNHSGSFPAQMYGLKIRPSKYAQDYGVRNLQKAAILKLQEQGRDVMPGESVKVVVNSFSGKILNDPELPPDRKFYRTLIERNLEPFDFMFKQIIEEKNHDLIWWSKKLQSSIS